MITKKRGDHEQQACRSGGIMDRPDAAEVS